MTNVLGGRKLLAEEYFVEGRESDCAFYLSESASPSLRTLAVYRDEQMLNAGIYLYYINLVRLPI